MMKKNIKVASHSTLDRRNLHGTVVDSPEEEKARDYESSKVGDEKTSFFRCHLVCTDGDADSYEQEYECEDQVKYSSGAGKVGAHGGAVGRGEHWWLEYISD